MSCICVNQNYENRKQGECTRADSDGMWFDNNLLNIYAGYEGDEYKVNYCPFCGSNINNQNREEESN